MSVSAVSILLSRTLELRRHASRHVMLCLLLWTSLCAWSRVGLAQLTTAEEKGLPSNSAFSGGDVDVVNLQNGNLHISIPIEASAQRGGTVLKWTFVYDTQAWNVQWNPYQCSTPCTPSGQYIPGESTSVVSGWRVSSPFNWAVTNTSSGAINCATTSETYTQYTNWGIIDPEGTQHALPLRQETGTSSCFGQTLQGPALDGSGLYYNASAQILYTQDGYQFSGGQFVNGVGLLNAGQDRNGNQVTATSDTLARNLVTTFNGTTAGGMPYTTYTLHNSADNPLVFRVDYQAVTLKSDICAAAQAIDSAATCTDITHSYDLPSMLTLPTGKTYAFKYAANTPGDLIELDLPTGASITYQYEDFYQEKVNPLLPAHPNFVGSRAVTERTETVNGVANLWKYNPGPITDKVTDPLNNYQVHTFSFINATNPGGQLVASSNVYEMSVAYYNKQGQLVKTTSNTYGADYDPVNNTTANARVTQTTTAWANGQTSAVQTDYETFSYPCVNTGGACTGTGSRLNPTETREYDYGSGSVGALLKKTDYLYLHTNNQPYIALNIVDKPTTVTAYDGSGAMAAQTVNEYDNYSHTGQSMQASNAVQHSASYSTGYTTRGNLTAASKWLNTSGALLTTTMQFDDAGNVLSTIDPNLNKTLYSFTDSWANAACAPSGTAAAFPTKVTNAKGQFASKTYNSCTGTVATATDTNSQVTQYAYDTFDRPHQTTLPDKGLRTFCYSDDPNGSCYKAASLTSSETEAINGTTNLVRTTLYDALGRPSETQLNSDPQGTVYVDTRYDGDGRAYMVSNPYRTGDPLYWTTQLYDGIGRSAGVVHQDGTSSSITYTGNLVQSTDEAGNKRNSQFDALGRQTAVWEDPSGLNYETDYLYNALGNLLQVTQKGGSTSAASWRVRTFTYNSLSELLCAANPEINTQLSTVATCPAKDTGSYIAGTTRYGYDNDGNLSSKTAPKPNQTGTATLVVSYSYDTLNRLLSKSYNDGSTPSTCYQYDLSTLGIGRLANQWTQSASVASCGTSFPPTTKYLIATSVTAYDPMGRLLNEQQYTPATIASGKPYPMAYTYDLIGDLTSSTSGAAPPSMTFSSPTSCPSTSPLITTVLAFSNCYDAAGHLQSVASNANIGPVNMFSGAGYAAFGGLANATLGNSAVSVTRTYDSRLRIASESDMGNTPATATSGVATVTINGAEQSH